MTTKEVKQKNIKVEDPLQRSWAQIIVILIILSSGIFGLFLPIPLLNQNLILLAMTVSIVTVICYFRFPILHKRNTTELLLDMILALSVFMVVFAAREYGFHMMYLFYLLSLPVAIVHRYSRFLLVLIVLSLGIVLFYFFNQEYLPQNSIWIVIFNIIALWGITHFVWFYAQDANKITIEHQLTKSKMIQLKELDERRAEFLHIAAHQLKNPLSIIKLILHNVAKDDKLSDSKKKKVKQALSQSQTAVEFLEDTSKILNLEQKKDVVSKKPIEIEDLIKEIINSLSEIIKKKKIHLTKHIGGVMPTTKTDDFFLKIALTNVIENAVKYSPDGGRVIINVFADKDFVHVVVKDSGIGISKSDQNRIFEKFFRGQNAKKHLPNGTGLGLNIVKEVLNKIGGHISFESKIYRGSSFKLSVPIS